MPFRKSTNIRIFVPITLYTGNTLKSILLALFFIARSLCEYSITFVIIVTSPLGFYLVEHTHPLGAHFMEPSVYIALDKSYKIKSGENTGKYHAKIWVIFPTWSGGKKRWPQNPYPTGLFVTEREFAALMENDPKKKTRVERLKEIRKKLDDEKERAEQIIERNKVTTKARFDQYFRPGDVKPESLEGQFKLKISELRVAKPKPKLSSAEKYESSLKSLQEFFKTKHVTFQMCTGEALQDYESWYTDSEGKNGSLTTVGINLRCLRHIFRRAIKAHIISETTYPFRASNDDDNEDLYTIPDGDGDGVHEFLSTEDKDKLLNHKFIAYCCDKCHAFVRKKSKIFPICPWCRNGTLQEVSDEGFNERHDYAVFSYFAHGMNASDMFRMRKSQIKDDHIVIMREKTRTRKKKKNQIQTIPIHPRMREIIVRRGVKTIGIVDSFVFPILDASMKEEQILKAIKRKVKDIDEMLAAMAKDLSWQFKPTMYTLRHTFSNEYIQLGANTEQLQYALGHGLASTTEVYKHGFRLAIQKKLSDGLG